ncbi:peptidase S8 [Candidatus Cerribacteria bacterium 'Amazon FNV 2010 28 9']|uniref:Peptidase S8 n=1 Tax=Candidatus Cerribacteria bacterium 'Amazon FNV 2010 28 9' TaxID=2081795 RepID=A0A317JTS7_9BACT|nr:MAG: peptidase S8 [Candidatus Cerribacteria bacterium 'Amazon FNV 2010 28 9']
MDNSLQPFAATTPAGYGPAQLRGAYNLTGKATGNPVVAVIDAYDQPNIASNVNTYSTTFGLPTLPTCSGAIKSSSTACFQKLDQKGGTNYPSQNAGWDLETSLDVETVHAMCENCKILLVEAKSASFTDLLTAFDTAIAKGATIISNSYGGNESSGETTYDAHFQHPGLVMTFSSGDSGYGVSYPAASKYVTAVGGTTLNVNGSNGSFSYGSESVWSGAGSGCSAYESKPSFQTDSGCKKRTVVDVSADADPSTGVAVYDTVKFQNKSGWFTVGGTSLAAPLVAAVYAQSTGIKSSTYANSVPYADVSYTKTLHDIVTGANDQSCSSYLCEGAKGYDGPSGLGSPNGISAFGM